ncbi:hypothetical protein M8494_31090 [Serratia ureilytica]
MGCSLWFVQRCADHPAHRRAWGGDDVSLHHRPEMRPLICGTCGAIFSAWQPAGIELQLLLTATGMAFGFSLAISFICGMGFVLTSTAIVMQLLANAATSPARAVRKSSPHCCLKILMIVPLLALVAFIAPAGSSTPVSGSPGRIAIAAGALAALVAPASGC